MEKVAAAQLRESSVQNFSNEVSFIEAEAGRAWIYNYGSLSAKAQENLGSAWAPCNSKSGKYSRLGVSMLSEELPERSVTYAVSCPEDLRRIERQKYSARLHVTATQYAEWHFAFYFDTRPHVIAGARFSLGITFFVLFALVFTAMVITNDANRLGVRPLENMMLKVQAIRENPLNAIKIAEGDFKHQLKAAAMERRKGFDCLRWIKTTWRKLDVKEPDVMETRILETTIMKLGSLLALGFGVAGSAIVANTMSSDTIGCMFDGRRVECIIGTTRIHDFSSATEVLQRKIMTFVNQIAEIVHGVVDEFNGAANRNDGEAFLLIWMASDWGEDDKTKLADMSMLAVTRILGAVHRSHVLAAYREHPGLLQRHITRVNVSSGLHYGWAIEGAVGSEFKIDASYLSPNVSIAQSVERATRSYNVSIMLSDSLKAICTPDMASQCRLIDRVMITGSVDPIELYVIDFDYLQLTLEEPHAKLKGGLNLGRRFKARQFLEVEKRSKWTDGFSTAYWESHEDIRTMRSPYTTEFKYVFSMGYQNYLLGEWEVAQNLLKRTRGMLDNIRDGPSIALLRFMELHKFRAPHAWPRYRELELEHTTVRSTKTRL
jgi:class 3 adenylate cyclase